MELDNEGAANFEQLQDLIPKECGKRDRKYAWLEERYNKLEQQVAKKDKKMPQRGLWPNNEGTGTSNKNKSTKRHATNQPNTRLGSTPPNNNGQQKRRNSKKPRRSRRKKQRFQAKKRKQTLVALSKQINSESTQYCWQEKTAKMPQRKKLTAQFGFAADPTLSTRHNTSTTLAKMPIWYYFSRPSNLAFHDFTKQQKPEKIYNLYWDFDLNLSQLQASRTHGVV